jgi:ribonuclease P protein component
VKTNLRASSDFKRVYQRGKRYDGLLMTAFVLANDQPHHRLGLTASRKMSARAVGRNRAKRLLRESFRLHARTLDRLQGKYDWVLNAKRTLLSVSLLEPLEEFSRIIKRVERDEESIARA